jgi:DNA-binding NarL/FixJ family response regulator
MTDDILRVMHVEDHPVYRAGLRSILSTDPGLCVVGEATNGADAVRLATELQPDVVLMDLRLPELGGIECTRQILGVSPHISVLVLTMFGDDESWHAAIRAGARGYLLKHAKREVILHAVHAVAVGASIYGDGVAERVTRYLTSSVGVPGRAAFPQLTDREFQVLDIVAAGLNNTEIARRLKLEPKTVRNYVSNILDKLPAADRAQAIVRAREAGLGAQPPCEVLGSDNRGSTRRA